MVVYGSSSATVTVTAEGVTGAEEWGEHANDDKWLKVKVKDRAGAPLEGATVYLAYYGQLGLPTWTPPVLTENSDRRGLVEIEATEVDTHIAMTHREGKVVKCKVHAGKSDLWSQVVTFDYIDELYVYTGTIPAHFSPHKITLNVTSEKEPGAQEEAEDSWKALVALLPYVIIGVIVLAVIELIPRGRED